MYMSRDIHHFHVLDVAKQRIFIKIDKVNTSYETYTAKHSKVIGNLQFTVVDEAMLLNMITNDLLLVPS